jgi:hypothetical protein
MDLETNATTAIPAPARLVDVKIINENVAFNVIISFTTLAQKRGAYTIEESAKLWECIQRIQQASTSLTTASTSTTTSSSTLVE